MGRPDTTGVRKLAAAALTLAAGTMLFAQTPAARPDWRRIGTTTISLNLSSPAGGPVERVWFDATGVLHARLGAGKVFATLDMEKWQPVAIEAPQIDRNTLVRLAGGVSYRAGAQVWRSDNDGLAWNNLTEVSGQSLLGGAVLDLAVDPSSADRVAVATETGVWMTTDGGRTWVGLNDGLPNMALRRILAAPRGSNGVRVAAATAGRIMTFEWRSGDTGGWQEADDPALAREAAMRQAAAGRLDAPISSAAEQDGTWYAGAEDGRIWASGDGGFGWRLSTGTVGGRVERIWINPAEPRAALAVVSAGASQSRLLRTVNGGVWWEDLTTNLGETTIYGVTAHAATGAVYLATARGVYWTSSDLRAPSPPTPWQHLADGWPAGRVNDVRLDDSGHLLLAAVEGEGVFSVLAPHRLRQPVLVDAADGAQRAIAPGSLLSLLGGQAESVTAQGRRGRVLAAQETESQIQLPYSLNGTRVDIEIAGRHGRLAFELPLRRAAPAIVVGGDGSPMVLDAESGLQLDSLNTARGGMRLQILMNGLGRVIPDWPVGMAAPSSDPPKVAAPLKAWLDGAELPVERATLAPGYIGYYLVELRLPEFLPQGAVELSFEASGERSNRVRLYVAE